MSIKKLSTIDADTLQSIPYAPLPFVVRTCCPRASTCWRERRRSASPGWPCGYVSVPPRANRSGTSPQNLAKFSTSVWKTVSSASRVGSLISPRTRLRRCTLP